MMQPGNDPPDEDPPEEDRGDDEPARTKRPRELGFTDFANAGSWLVFGTLIAGALLMMIVGLVLFMSKGKPDGMLMVVVGGPVAWFFARRLKGALAEHRPVAARYADDEDEDDDEGKEYWRVPGYGTDTAERSGDARDDDERPRR
jgi:hypothetical protein